MAGREELESAIRRSAWAVVTRPDHRKTWYVFVKSSLSNDRRGDLKPVHGEATSRTLSLGRVFFYLPHQLWYVLPSCVAASIVKKVQIMTSFVRLSMLESGQLGTISGGDTHIQHNPMNSKRLLLSLCTLSAAWHCSIGVESWGNMLPLCKSSKMRASPRLGAQFEHYFMPH